MPQKIRKDETPHRILIRVLQWFPVLAVAAVLALAAQEQQKITKFDRDRVHDMLHVIAIDVKKHYYDATYHGVDWDATVRSAEQRIEAATSLNHALSEIAAAMDVLNDSHTFFLPPSRPYKHDYGWRIEMVGQKCFVMQVRPQSDAEVKQVKRGDQILSINGFQPTRESLWKMNYVFDILRPQPGLRVKLLSPDGQSREVEVMAAMRQTKKVANLTIINGSDIWDLIRESETLEHLGRVRWAEASDDVAILKFPGFHFDEAHIDEMIKKARKYKAWIIDLRGNPGGSVETLKWFLGGIFDKEVMVGDRVTRDDSKPLVAKSKRQNAYSGKLVVLVDSKSASASELFARVVQLEKRGTVLGDQTAGAVMESKRYSYKHGVETVVFYGASITDADLIMTDGKSLEHTGVTPDEFLLPTAEDLASGRDPVLTRAVELCGAKMTPEAAGALFPFEWPPQ
jgi:C-terminal processing protease CtpA/Prc